MEASATTPGEQPRNPRSPDPHLTHKGDHPQLGLQEAPFTPHAHPEQHKRNPKHRTAPAGTGIPRRGPNHQGSRTFPMADQQLNAPPCGQSQVPADVPPGGIHHINRRHADRFTVVGNHLVQHRQLSLTAIGLAAHIQSLPRGASATIKTLASRFPEGEVRIAAALRELEAHGYLTRTRERLASGRMVTRTTSYNNPLAMIGSSAPNPSRKPHTPATPPRPNLPIAPSTPPAATPENSTPSTPSDPAASLLADLRRDDPRLLLATRDVHRLAPAVTTWLDRGITPEAVRRTLTAGLPPEPLRSPAALLSHRLTELLPPPLPARAPMTPPPPRPAPLQNCDGCDRAFRSPKPGKCATCRPPESKVA